MQKVGLLWIMNEVWCLGTLCLILPVFHRIYWIYFRRLFGSVRACGQSKLKIHFLSQVWMLRAPPATLYFCEHFYFLTVECLSRWAAPLTRRSWDIFSQSYRIWKAVRSVFVSGPLFTHLLELVLLAEALSSLDWPVRGSWFGLGQRCSLVVSSSHSSWVASQAGEHGTHG